MCVCVCVLAAKFGVHVEKLVLHLHVKLSRSFCDRLMAWDIRVTRVEHVLPLGQRCAVAESKIEVQHNYWKQFPDELPQLQLGPERQTSVGGLDISKEHVQWERKKLRMIVKFMLITMLK